MISYIKVAVRNIIKDKYYSLLNILGLVVGLTACLLLVTYAMHESTYDTYHEKADQLYRIESYGDARLESNDDKLGFMPIQLAGVLLKEYPEIENVCRVTNLGGVMLTTEDQKGLHDWSVLTADTNVFEMFDYEFIEGDPATALTEPNTAVITRDISEKLFGNESPVGKLLRLNNDTVMHRITALIETPPTNTHIRPSLFIAESYFGDQPDHWLNNAYFTYVQLAKGADPEAFDAKMPALLEKYYNPDLERLTGKPYSEIYTNGRKMTYKLLPVNDVHLYADLPMDVAGKSGNATVAHIFILSALAVLLLASINYVNLCTARSTTRIKEIAIRKASGATRLNLMVQFLLESVLMSLFAVGGAAVLTQLLLPGFCTMTQLEVVVPFLSISWMLPALIIFAIVLGLVSGLYPAYIITGFNAVDGLKSKNKQVGDGALLRKALVVVQFSLSFVILFSAFITSKQFSYMMERDWGYDRSNLMIIYEAGVLGDRQKQFKNEILESAYVNSATLSSTLPFHALIHGLRSVPGDTTRAQKGTYMTYCDRDYFKTLGIELVQGRMYDEASENQFKCIINETAAREYGFDNPIGKFINHPRVCDTIPPLEIVGVVKDYNFMSLANEIAPMEVSMAPIDGQYNYALVRYATGAEQKALDEIRTVWKKYNDNRDIHYAFLDEQVEWHYRNEISSKKALGYFSVVTLFIACLGLIGLISYASLRRKKEIGVRKVNGATVFEVMLLLSRETVYFLGIAIAIAIPAGYYLASYWLNSFAYHIEIEPIYFVGTALVLCSIALVTETLVTQYSARQNPALSLRDE